MRQKTMKAITGGGEKVRTMPVTTAGMSRDYKIEVCQTKYKKTTRINEQSASLGSTPCTKQQKLTSQFRTNTRPLALDRQTTTATGSGTTATTKHAILLSTLHHLRVAQLNIKRNLYTLIFIMQPSRP